MYLATLQMSEWWLRAPECETQRRSRPMEEPSMTTSAIIAPMMTRNCQMTRNIRSTTNLDYRILATFMRLDAESCIQPGL